MEISLLLITFASHKLSFSIITFLMNRLLYLASAAAAVSMAIFSCSKQPQWSLDANIKDAPEGSTIVLEAANPAGYWYALDTLTVGSDGSFSTSQPAAQYPDIFRLNFNGKYIYFPIDSIEKLTLTADTANFARSYQLDGSENAKLITHVEDRINSFLAHHNVADLDTARSLKRELSGMIMGDPSSIVAFYITNKQINGHRLFNTDNRQDLGIIGAVANSYSEFRPGDPRTQYLKDLWIKNKGKFSNRVDTIAANEIRILEIEGFDEKGTNRKLSTATVNNKLVVLNFTNYSADFSQPLNIALREIYDAHHAQGLEVFQLGFDGNEFQWRMAAGNQPWITVYNGSTDQNLRNYNVGSLPAIFIINNGEIVERITDISNLKSSIARYL